MCPGAEVLPVLPGTAIGSHPDALVPHPLGRVLAVEDSEPVAFSCHGRARAHRRGLCDALTDFGVGSAGNTVSDEWFAGTVARSLGTMSMQ